jgi:hypothetical protein
MAASSDRARPPDLVLNDYGSNFNERPHLESGNELGYTPHDLPDTPGSSSLPRGAMSPHTRNLHSVPEYQPVGCALVLPPLQSCADQALSSSRRSAIRRQSRVTTSTSSTPRTRPKRIGRGITPSHLRQRSYPSRSGRPCPCVRGSGSRLPLF